jgi:hypothetical protein
MRLATFFIVLALVYCSTLAADKTEYPRPELLLEPTALAKSEVGKQFIVLDARAQKAFDESRVPVARWVDGVAGSAAWESTAIPESLCMTVVPRRTLPGSGGFYDIGA